METAVLETYKRAAKDKNLKLCCPVSYARPELLKIIPEEILEKDYGCGDPTQYVREGEVVIDLGSGSGKHCYMIAQIVGPKGKVIGIDFNDEMLRLARKYQNYIAEKLGYLNTEFRKARIQNLRLDLEKVEAYLSQNPIRTAQDLIQFEEFVKRLEREGPLIPDNSIDTVVSNCVLNLVKEEDKEALFKEIYRVLKPEGRAVISDIVCDEDVPEHLKKDPELWAGCIAGAMREDRFLYAFLEAGFKSVRILKYEREPWQVIDGLEFRSITVEAVKGKNGACIDKGHTVIYLGPFVRVEDAEGHIFELGKRVAVCERTFHNLKLYAKDYFVFISPQKELQAKPFPCNEKIIYRSPRETKGAKWEGSEKTLSVCCEREPFKPFAEKLSSLGKSLTKGEIEIFQINVGYKCNESCLHCHLSAGPKGPLMEKEVMEACLELIKRNPGKVVDITGGSPELHPEIELFLERLSPFAREMYFRTNLTALKEKKELLKLLKKLKVKIIASLPDPEEKKTDFLRGKGFYQRALEMIYILNHEGFGRDYPLYLMVNPTELTLARPQAEEKERFAQFFKGKGLVITDLFVLNNIPLGRFKEYLLKEGKYSTYLDMLYQNFNEQTLDKVMCLTLLNIGPDGALYDCDFNQALSLKIDGPKDIFELLEKGLSSLYGKRIKTGDHCYGCTALFGTSCFGSLE